MTVNIEDVEATAKIIAEKLRDIKRAEREKTVLQNKLSSLILEQNSIKEQLNKLDSLITSSKFEIANRLSEETELKLVKVETK